MKLNGRFNLQSILSAFRLKVLATWLMVLLENILLALIPLLIGFAIDGLLEGQNQSLYLLAIIMVILTITSVMRRFYDTRTYGSIRVALGTSLNERCQGMAVSARNARLDMARELVDFLEDDLPELLTSVVQIVMVIIVLAAFHVRFAVGAVIVLAGMAVFYWLFHGHFYRYNQSMNSQMEQQIKILVTLSRLS